MRIILDAFGGDNAPLEILRGAQQAVEKDGLSILLTGREEEIRRVAAENNISLAGMEIADAPDVISMNDEPRSILKAHKDCSMAEGLRRLAAGEGDAFVSAGSTGALLMGATFIVKRIKGISRPALASLLPSDKEPYLLVDCGANADCRPEMLLQFAQMGRIYMTHVLGRKDAKIGLLNIGTEEHKGGSLQLETFALLKQSGLPFIGNVEARDVPAGAADVIVADGFTGNILLKTMEGTVSMLLHNLKAIFKTNLLTKLAAALVLPHMKGLKSRLNASKYGGAPVIGVQKPVIKAHGNADAAVIYGALHQAAIFVETGVMDAIRAAVTPAEPAKEEE